MLLKICGLTRREDAETAVSLGVDLLGFVFVPGTPRAVTAGEVQWIRDLRGAETVGVFRDARLGDVLDVVDRFGLDRVQLHGSEPDSWLDRLGPLTLRRVRPRADGDWSQIAELANRCLPLIDPGCGDGLSFDWSTLATRPPGLKLGLAGGLDAGNVGTAIRMVHPDLVDVSSGVEARPGVKDPLKMADFVHAARHAESVESSVEAE